MPAHSFLIQSHFREARSEPAVFEVAVQVWRASVRAEKQAILSGRIGS